MPLLNRKNRVILRVCQWLTEDKDAALVDSDSVRAATVVHGGACVPHVPSYVVALHGAQLALAIVASDGVEVRVQTDQTCKQRRDFTVRFAIFGDFEEETARNTNPPHPPEE